MDTIKSDKLHSKTIDFLLSMVSISEATVIQLTCLLHQPFSRKHDLPLSQLEVIITKNLVCRVFMRVSPKVSSEHYSKDLGIWACVWFSKHHRTKIEYKFKLDFPVNNPISVIQFSQYFLLYLEIDLFTKLIKRYLTWIARGHVLLHSLPVSSLSV